MSAGTDGDSGVGSGVGSTVGGAASGGPGPTLVGGRYELGPVIGYGGMAEVHRGLDTRLGRTVAIKLLRATLAQDETFQERFRREATASASLNHPCIISVYDTGDGTASTGPARGLPYIVMEYVEGRTLRDVLQERRRILPERALEITAGILSALDYSHRMGIVHRDIKPANVMLTPSGEVKVMDFGIARAVEETSTSVTQTAAVIGTAQYLSPEQARGDLVGPGGDIYSVGVVLYELLVGRPPFTGSSPVALAVSHVRDIPDAPAVVDPEVPAAASAIAMCALAKDPADRYLGALAMREDIERALAGRPVWAASTSAGRAVAAEDAARGPVGAGWGAAEETAYTPAGDVEQTGYTGLPTQVGATGPGRGWPAGAAGAAGAAAGLAGVTVARADPAGVAHRLDGSPDDALTGDGRSKRRGGLIAALAVLVALALAGVVVGVYKLATGPGATADTQPSASSTPTVTAILVPTLTGRTTAEAQRLVTGAGLVVGTTTRRADAVLPDGRVLAQTPVAGATAARNDSVDLVVSSGPGQVTIPDIAGQQLDVATATLQRAQLKVAPAGQNSPERAGTVLQTDPNAGRTVEPGTSVTVRYANGRNDVSDTVGSPVDVATAQLETAGFTVFVQPQVSADRAAGVVLDQAPRSGSAALSSRVTLFVAAPPAATPTPSPTAQPTSPDPTPSASSPAPTPTPTPTFTPSATPTPTPTPSATTASRTPSPSASPSR